MGVTEVRLVAKRVQDQDVEVLEERKAFVGNVTHIGEVGSFTEAVTSDLLAAMSDRYLLESYSEDIDGGASGGIKPVELDTRAGGIALGGIRKEGVVEDAFERAGGRFVSVDGQVAIDVEAERAQVVKSKDMVGVAVGVQDSIDPTDTFTEGLSVEVRACIDQNRAVIVCEADGGTGSPVAWVASGGYGRGADWAVTAQGGHPHGGAAAEEGEGGPHGLADDTGAAWPGGRASTGTSAGGFGCG